MTFIPENDDEKEQARLDTLSCTSITRPENFAPGTFGCHEALYTAYLMFSFLEQNLLKHPAILHNLNGIAARRAPAMNSCSFITK
jgi:hypothetical protein